MMYDPAFQYPAFTTRLTAITASPTGVVQLVGVVPSRISLIFQPQGFATGTRVWINTTVSGTKGIPFQQNNDPLVFTYHDYGALVSGEWYVRSSSGSPVIDIIEVLYDPLILGE